MSTEQKRILVFSDWFLPGYRAGGPIRSLVNLVNALPYQFLIVTSIKDHHHEVPYKNITPNEWTQYAAHVKVMYLSDDKINNTTFRDLMSASQYDKIYFNSLFSPRFTIAPLLVARKMKLQHQVVLAPRGMLKSGALSVKAWKKKIFLRYAKLTSLYKNIIWHATNSDEVDEIRSLFRVAQDIRLAPNLPSLPKGKPTKPLKRSGDMKLVCIARISPEKGILEAVQYLKSAQLDGYVQCDFYGTQQNAEYLKQCETLAQSIPKVHIAFKGEIEPHNIHDLLSGYHFFYMPTWGENFGHAIAEALNAATPVLISSNTPWQDLPSKHAGWNLPLNEKQFAQQLNALLQMEQDEYRMWSNGAYELGYSTAHDVELVEASYRLFG
ncbi:MAG: glycosyltransferase family 4 protein [Flavobacteriales bacterium]